MKILTVLVGLCLSASVWAGVDGAISGTVTDSEHIAIMGARVQLLDSSGKMVKKTTSDAGGGFGFFPVSFGTYQISVTANGYSGFSAQTVITSSSTAQVDVALIKGDGGHEMVLTVKAKKRLVQPSASGSKQDISHEQIEALPGGTDTPLPKLMAETMPGIVQAPFGQMFIRGNHAFMQYQIDGVQLPDSISGSFGEAFSTRNIDHMEIITGGVPAEYGERMAAVINIISKTGAEEPSGSAELNYGSYNTFNPEANYGGSTKDGRLHYFVAASYLQTDRGLDTPQPKSYSDQEHGGEEAVHDKATGNDQFIKLDDIWDNSDKVSLILFNEQRTYQEPNYPDSFLKTDPYFSSNYTDAFGNTANGQPIFSWTPPDTGDSQAEQNTYVEAVWKRTISEKSFLQVAPYYKRSALQFNNDPTNDLAALAAPNAIAGAVPASFAMNRSVNNYGLKTDYTWRVNDEHLFKSGFQAQDSQAAGNFTIQTAIGGPVSYFGTPDHGDLEAVYAQDNYSITKTLQLNAGLRYSAIQFYSPDTSEQQEGLLQPRIGLEYMATTATKLHVFYGKLFTPAPFENLRAAYVATGGNSAQPYDIKAERDDYYETGVEQQIGEHQTAKLNYYYKDATNMLDDTQLLNTSIAQPFNFAKGYATGIELSISGDLTPHLSDFFNYSYEDAKGYGMSGGFFTTQVNPSAWYYLDHCQLDTANAGLTYKTDSYWLTLLGLYGSGLRTGLNNTISLPPHTTFDFSAGYVFHSDNWWKKWKASFDVTNITDDAYPIFIANGFNGSHYAAGREFFVRLAKDL